MTKMNELDILCVLPLCRLTSEMRTTSLQGTTIMSQCVIIRRFHCTWFCGSLLALPECLTANNPPLELLQTKLSGHDIVQFSITHLLHATEWQIISS